MNTVVIRGYIVAHWLRSTLALEMLAFERCEECWLDECCYIKQSQPGQYIGQEV